MTYPKCNGPDACNTQPAKTITEHASILPTAEKIGNTDKEFSTLRAQFALHGHGLHRTTAATGEATFYSEKWGMVRFLATLDDVRQFLAQIGGAA